MSTAISVTLVLSLLALLCDSTGGQGRLVGGWSNYDQSSNSATFNKVVAVANKYLTDNGHVGQSCANSNLRPSEAQSQVVSGMNYRVTYRIPSTCSANGASLTCVIVVYAPLPYTNQDPRVTENMSSCQ